MNIYGINCKKKTAHNKSFFKSQLNGQTQDSPNWWVLGFEGGQYNCSLKSRTLHSSKKKFTTLHVDRASWSFWVSASFIWGQTHVSANDWRKNCLCVSHYKYGFGLSYHFFMNKQYLGMLCVLIHIAAASGQSIRFIVLSLSMATRCSWLWTVSTTLVPFSIVRNRLFLFWISWRVDEILIRTSLAFQFSSTHRVNARGFWNSEVWR
jgi:hypothetical protein